MRRRSGSTYQASAVQSTNRQQPLPVAFPPAHAAKTPLSWLSDSAILAKIRSEANRTVKRNWALPATIVCVLALSREGRAQTCNEPFYRWSEKVDESLASVIPRRTSIATMLGQWAPLALMRHDECAPRAGRELRTYSVIAWIRRVKKRETDGDWHVEITSQANSSPTTCVVAEIPPTSPNGNFGQARADLDAMLASAQVAGDGEVTPPIHVRLVGAAFYDGFHHTAVGGASGHGSCNSSGRALWELHPIYFVRSPP